MFKTRKEEEAYRAEINRLRLESYAAQQSTIAEAPFAKLSKLIKSGDRFSHHWQAMKAKYGNISIKYEVAYHPWGNKYGYVSKVESADGREWRGTEGAENGNVTASIHGPRP